MKKISALILTVAMIFAMVAVPVVSYAETTETFSMDFANASESEMNFYKDFSSVSLLNETGRIQMYNDEEGLVLKNNRPSGETSYDDYIYLVPTKVEQAYDADLRTALIKSDFKGELSIDFKFIPRRQGGQWRFAIVGIQDDGTLVNSNPLLQNNGFQFQSYGYEGPDGTTIAQVDDLADEPATLNIKLNTWTGDFTVAMFKNGEQVGNSSTGKWEIYGEEVAFHGFSICPVNQGGATYPATIVVEEIAVECSNDAAQDEIESVKNAADAISSTDIATNIGAMKPGTITLPIIDESYGVDVNWQTNNDKVILIEDGKATIAPNTQSHENAEPYLVAKITNGDACIKKVFKLNVPSYLLYTKDIGGDEADLNNLIERGIIGVYEGNGNIVKPWVTPLSGYGLCVDIKNSNYSYNFNNAYLDYYFKDWCVPYSDDTRSELWYEGFAGKLRLQYILKVHNAYDYRAYILMEDPDGNIVVQEADEQPYISASDGRPATWSFNGEVPLDTKENTVVVDSYIDTLTGEVSCSFNSSSPVTAQLPYYGEGYKFVGLRLFGYGGPDSTRCVSLMDLNLSYYDADDDALAVKSASEALNAQAMGVNLNCVTGDIDLPASLLGADITWESENGDVITNNGQVTIPEIQGLSENAQLVATISKGDYVAKKRFYITVVNPGIIISDITPDVASGTVSYILTNNTPNAVNGVAYLASYAGNELVGLNVKSLENIEFGASVDMNQSLNLTATPDTVKLIVTSSNLMPLMKAITYEITQ